MRLFLLAVILGACGGATTPASAEGGSRHDRAVRECVSRGGTVEMRTDIDGRLYVWACTGVTR